MAAVQPLNEALYRLVIEALQVVHLFGLAVLRSSPSRHGSPRHQPLPRQAAAPGLKSPGSESSAPSSSSTGPGGQRLPQIPPSPSPSALISPLPSSLLGRSLHLSHPPRLVSGLR